MAADAIIDVILKMQDKLTPELDKAVNGVEKFAKSNTKVRDTLAGVGVASAAISVGVGAVMADAAKSAIDAESSFLELNKQLGLSEQEFNKVSQQISSMGAAMGLSVTQSANLGAEVAKAGLSGKDLEKTFKDIQESSVALSIDTEKMTDKYLQMYATFGNDTKKMMQDVNILADNSATGAQQIIDAFAGISPIVKQFGLDTKNVMAEMTVALEKGFDPSRVQNAYKDLMLTLSRGYGELPEKANEALAEIYDGQGTQLNVIWQTQGAEAALKDFKSRLANIKDEGARINLIQTIFGTNYASELSAILGNVETVQKYTGLIADDGKNAAAFAKEFDRQSGTTAHQAKVLAANWDMLKITIGKAILPALNDIMKVVTPMVKSFAEWASNNPELVKMGVTIAGIVVAVTGLLAIVATIGAGLAGLGAFGAAFSGIGAIVTGVGVGIAGIIASPALLVAAIVAAVGVIVYLIVTNWETVSKFLKQGLEMFVDFLKNWLEFVKNFWTTIFKGIWTVVSTFYSAVFNGAKTLFQNYINFLVQFWTAVFNGLKTFFQTLWNAYTSFVTMIWNGINSFFQMVVNGYIQFYTTLWNGITTFFTTALTTITGFFTTIWNGITTFFQNAVTGITAFFTNMLDVAKSFFQTVLTTITGFFTTVLNGIKTFFTNFITNFTQGFEQLKTLVTTSMELIKQAFIGGLENIKQAFNNTGAFFEGIKQTITGFIDFLKNVFQSGLDFLKTVVEGGLNIIKGIFETIVNFLIDLLKNFALSGGQSGADLMRNMADGINNNSHLVESAMKNATAKADSYLPHSPSKKGAFRTLDETGYGLMNTFSQGIKGYDIGNVMGNTSKSAKDSLSNSSGNISGSSNGSTITINYAPVINGGNGKSIIEELKNNQRVLVDLIEKANAKTNRRLY